MALNLGTLNIDIKANTTDATNRLDTVKSSAQDLEKHSKITLNVDADTSSVNKKLDETSAKIDELDGKSAGGAFNFTANLTDNVSGTLDSITTKTSGYKLTGLEGAISSLNALISGDGDGSIIKAFSSLAGSTGLSSAISGITAYLTGKGLEGAGSESIATHIARLTGTTIPGITGAFKAIGTASALGVAVKNIADFLTGNGATLSVKQVYDNLIAHITAFKLENAIFNYEGALDAQKAWMTVIDNAVEEAIAKISTISSAYDVIKTKAVQAGWSDTEWQWYDVMGSFLDVDASTMITGSNKIAAAWNDPEKAAALTAASITKGASTYQNLFEVIKYASGLDGQSAQLAFLNSVGIESEQAAKLMPAIAADWTQIGQYEETLKQGGAFRTQEEIDAAAMTNNLIEINEKLGTALDEQGYFYALPETQAALTAESVYKLAEKAMMEEYANNGLSEEYYKLQDEYDRTHAELIAAQSILNNKIAEWQIAKNTMTDYGDDEFLKLSQYWLYAQSAPDTNVPGLDLTYDTAYTNAKNEYLKKRSGAESAGYDISYWQMTPDEIATLQQKYIEAGATSDVLASIVETMDWTAMTVETYKYLEDLYNQDTAMNGVYKVGNTYRHVNKNNGMINVAGYWFTPEALNAEEAEVNLSSETILGAALRILGFSDLDTFLSKTGLSEENANFLKDDILGYSNYYASGNMMEDEYFWNVWFLLSDALADYTKQATSEPENTPAEPSTLIETEVRDGGTQINYSEGSTHIETQNIYNKLIDDGGNVAEAFSTTGG